MMTEKLKEYLKNASPEQLVRDWNDLSKYNNGIDVKEFLRCMTKEEFYKEYLEYKLFPESAKPSLKVLAEALGARVSLVAHNGNCYSVLYKNKFDFSKIEISNKSIFEIMTMFKTEVEANALMDTVKPGDIVLFVDGTHGLVVMDDGYEFIISCNGSYESDKDILEVRRPKEITVNINSDEFSNYELVWPIRPTCFVGVSYEANALAEEAVKSELEIIENYKVIEWDDFLSEESNNKRVQEADEHVVIPPASFNRNHIIGMGLYYQIKTRQDAGKTTSILCDGDLMQISQVLELKNPTTKQYAVVLV